MAKGEPVGRFFDNEVGGNDLLEQRQQGRLVVAGHVAQDREVIATAGDRSTYARHPAMGT